MAVVAQASQFPRPAHLLPLQFVLRRDDTPVAREADYSAKFAWLSDLDIPARSPGAKNNIGILLGVHGNTPAALEAFKAALALGSPTDASMAFVHYNYGLLLCQIGQSAEAAAEFEAARAADAMHHAGATTELLTQCGVLDPEIVSAAARRSNGVRATMVARGSAAFEDFQSMIVPGSERRMSMGAAGLAPTRPHLGSINEGSSIKLAGPSAALGAKMGAAAASDTQSLSSSDEDLPPSPPDASSSSHKGVPMSVGGSSFGKIVAL